MSFKCEICGKGPKAGNSISHSHRKTRRTWRPNLQKVTIEKDGKKKRMRICTRCMRTMSHRK